MPPIIHRRSESQKSITPIPQNPNPLRKAGLQVARSGYSLQSKNENNKVDSKLPPITNIRSVSQAAVTPIPLNLHPLRNVGLKVPSESNSVERKNVNGSSKNFIRENLNKVVYSIRTPEEPKQSIPTTHKSYGKVPTYIKKYNRQKEQENLKRLAEIEQAKIPAGTRLVPEEERVATLKDLNAALIQT